MSKETISIDFDGTICEWAFPECGELNPGVKEAIDRLKDKYEIVISSCRTSAMFSNSPGRKQIIGAMIDFLASNHIYYDRIDFGDEGKVVAVAYIDDRAIPYKDNWKEIADALVGGE